MKRFRMGIIAVLIILTFGLTGCSTSILGGEWIVKVDGERVSEEDFNVRMADAKEVYAKQGLDFESEQGKPYLDQLKAQVISRLVEGRIIAQEVDTLKLDVNSPEVTEQMDSLKAGFGEDQTKYQDVLKQQAMTEQELLNFVALYVDVTKDVTVGDSEVEAYYEKNKGQYGQPEQVQARHILVETEQEAKDIIAQLNAGANFEQLAQEKSIDGSKEVGGELGYFGRGEMVPEFEEAAFAQAVGTWSQEPVQSQFGYHIILVEDHKQASAPSLAEIRADIEEAALNEAKDAKFQAYYDELSQKSVVEYAKGYEPAQ